MLYAYAITEPNPALDGVVGLDGSQTRAVGARGLALVASDLAFKPRGLTEEHLWEHESVVETLMESGPVLPMRAGTILTGEGAVQELLHDRGEELRQSLERVRGAVELGLRAVIEPEVPPERAHPAASGSEYMQAKLEVVKRERELAQRIHEPLAAMARMSAYRVKSTSPPQFQASYLVERDLIQAFREEVEEMEGVSGASALVVTGPWPPYSFAGSEDA